MNKLQLNLGAIICLALAIYGLYILLLDSILPLSIHSMLENINHWANHWHVIVSGLLPVYISLMIFGTSIAGFYLGYSLQTFLTRFVRRPKSKFSTKCKNDAIHVVRKSPLNVNSKVS